MKTSERTTETTAVIGANGMRREALDFVDLISKPDLYSKQSESSEHSFLILESAIWTKKSLSGISATILIGAGADQ
jgi:hypothetical protein